MHKPTEEWLETRAERLEVYGKEWLDWEKLIDAVLDEQRSIISGYVHPSRDINEWIVDTHDGMRVYNMQIVDWTILHSKQLSAIKSFPKELDKYKVLML